MKYQIVISLFVSAFMSTIVGFSQLRQQPNVILIMTDDQGFGDLGFTGNPHIKTPILDQFAKESIRLNNFHVSPVCAPTRSSLMTGRYSLRTGVRDTYQGGAIMATSEVTIAEMLKEGNYMTGIFGKWHLGDSYPSRPMDQGFDESIIHLAGGMGQGGDFTNHLNKNRSYFDPTLWHNGKQQKYDGYCSDIFTDEAINFIENNNNKNPFFCYLSFNAPHTPLQVPDKYYEVYKNIDPSTGFEKDERPFLKMSEKDKENARRVYAMVSNIDENIGKLLDKLNELKIADNTIVIFMTDNGPAHQRYIAGMKGLKSTVYRGGVRVPFFIRYPKAFKGNQEYDINAAHIDLLPTLSDLCSVQMPSGKKIDGENLAPVLRGEPISWSDRSLFFYWTRKYPVLYQNIALLKGSHKLVGHGGYNSDITEFELFDIQKDPFEQNNMVREYPKLAENLKNKLNQQFYELANSPNLHNPPRIIIGSAYENPTYLNRNDLENGKWNVQIKEGYYNVKFKFHDTLRVNGKMILETKPLINRMDHTMEGTNEIIMKNLYLPNLKGDLLPFYVDKDRKKITPFWVELEKI